MSVATVEDGNLITLFVDGAIDSTLGESLRTEASVALAAGRRRFLVNLQKARQANSAGLTVLVDLARTVTAAGGRVALVGPNQVLQDIFRATRLDRRFAVFESTEQALRNMRAEI
ncbi:MAG: STAS domain-containing protein [Planctomycetes bacterium]|nr:STAS domain-containing protein [Planctomycetota bacterium]